MLFRVSGSVRIWVLELTAIKKIEYGVCPTTIGTSSMLYMADAWNSIFLSLFMNWALEMRNNLSGQKNIADNMVSIDLLKASRMTDM